MLEKTLQSPLDCKEFQPVHPKGDQSWVFIGRTDAEAKTPILCLATSWEELTHWKRPWCWEGLGAGEEGDNRGWDGWTASPTWWTWVWVNFGSWWWTGRPGVLRFMGLQKVWHDWTDWLGLKASWLQAWASRVPIYKAKMNGAPKAVASVMITSESPSFTDEGTEAHSGWVT